MNDLDDKIRGELGKEEIEMREAFRDEPSMHEMMIDSFRGKHRMLMILNAFWMLVFLVLGVLAAIQFFDAEETRDIVMWAAACLVCVAAVSMMKVMWWMEVNRNALTREIKRLEWQVSRLVDHDGRREPKTT